MNEKQEQWQAYLDGELSETEAKEFTRELANDPEQSEAFAQFQSQHESAQQTLQVLRRHAQQPFDVDAQWKQLSRRLPSVAPAPSSQVWWRVALLGTGCAVAAMLMLPILRSTPTPSPTFSPPRPPAWIAKGISLRMLHQHQHQHQHRPQSRWSRNGTHLRPGDFVQFVYSTSAPLSLMVASIDTHGKISLYVPAEGPMSISVAKGKGTLPRGQAIELDDALGPERFFLLTHERPFSFAKVKQAILEQFRKAKSDIKRIKTLPGPWQLRQTLWITKSKELPPTPPHRTSPIHE